MNVIKTIGHSSHPLDRFIDLLKRGGVETVVDVRSVPYSGRFPQFGRERLKQSLSAAGIGYAWEGAALGGKPPGDGNYETVAARADFGDALDRLIDRARTSTLCLMCAEKEPLDCHRTVLVSRRLAERGAAVEHLQADGTIRPHADIEEALLGKDAGPDLFEDRAARLARAWQARERAMKGKSG